jgi:hypothetical protein
MNSISKRPPSFEKVNYLLRPRKQIERKIIIEILQELKPHFNDFREYEYIGMGSIYYYDFILFHKYLNLDNFISIDDKITRNRFEFNKPYDFISFENQKSTEFLKSHEWKKNTLIWLDYDLPILEVIEDFGILANSCKNNDILIFTIDAQTDIPDEQKSLIFSKLSAYISPQYKNNKYFTPLLFPTLLENIISNYFKERLLYEKLNLKKILSFTYSDRAKMYTFGGLITDREDIPALTNRFVRKNTEILEIDIPIITYKEKYYLDSIIKLLKSKLQFIREELDKGKIEENSDHEKIFIMKQLKLTIELSYKDLKGYVDYYKYYPQYYEGII